MKRQDFACSLKVCCHNSSFQSKSIICYSKYFSKQTISEFAFSISNYWVKYVFRCFNQIGVDRLTVLQQTSCSTLKNLLCGDKQLITLCLVKSVRPNHTSPLHNSTQFVGSVQSPLAREWTPKKLNWETEIICPSGANISIDVNKFSQVRLQSPSLPIENGWISQQKVCQLCLGFVLFSL